MDEDPELSEIQRLIGKGLYETLLCTLHTYQEEIRDRMRTADSDDVFDSLALELIELVWLIKRINNLVLLMD